MQYNLQQADTARDEQELLDWHKLKLFFLRRHKMFLWTFLLVAMLGAAMTLSLRPQYEGTAILLANTASLHNFGDAELPIVSYFVEATQVRSQKTQIDILSSPLILQAALQRLRASDRKTVGTYSVTDGKYSSAVFNVLADRDSNVITVSVMTYTPQAAAALANAICDEYIAQSRRQNQQQVLEATQYVQRKLGVIRIKLNRARKELRNYKERNQTVDLPAESQNLVQQLSQLKAERQQIHVDKVANIAELEGSKRIIRGISPTQFLPNTLVRRPSVETKKARLTELEIERLNALQEYRPTSPIIRKLNGQIAGLRHQLRQEAQTEVGNWQNQVNPVRLSLLQDIAKLQGQIWAQESRSTGLVASIYRVNAQIARLPEKEQRLSQLTVDLSSLQQIYEMLNRKHQELGISQGAHVADAQMVSSAQIADKKSTPRYGRSLAITFIVALMVSLGISVLIERIGNHVHSEKDIETIIDTPVLCSIPRWRKNTEQNLLNGLYAEPHILESYRRMRTHLLSSSKSDSYSVLITSSVPCEGKSTIALNFAVIAALSGKRVALVDADLRSPSLHKLLNLPNDKGFSNVITGTNSLSQVIQPTKLPTLQVLTSGPLLANAPEWLTSLATHTYLQEISKQVDLLVIDSSPILITVDSQILARQVDAVLLVISCQEPNKSEISSAMQLLARDGANIIGVVLNKQVTDQKQGSYYLKTHMPIIADPENDLHVLLKATSSSHREA